MNRAGNFQNPPLRGPVTPYGNLIPGATHSESVTPHTDVAPASWLPLAETDTNKKNGFSVWKEENKRDYIVITTGKPVALTRENLGLGYDDGPEGRVVPAGVRVAWAAAAAGDAVIEYGAIDVQERIQDITTGQPVEAPVSYTKAQVTAALQKRGLIYSSESAEDLISLPVGVINISAYAWCGGDGIQPAGYRFRNYKRQHKVSLLCDWVLSVPQVPSPQLTSLDVVAIDSTPTTGSTLESIAGTETPKNAGDVSWVTGDNDEIGTLGLDVRYGNLGTDYVGIVLGARRIEVVPHLQFKITRGGVDITSTVAKNRVGSPSELSSDGDFYVDTEMGIIFFYEEDGDGLPAGLQAADVISFAKQANHTDYVSSLVSAVGDIRPGDLVVVDALSNFRKFVSGTDKPEEVVGQVLTLSRYPREAMAMTKTYHDELPTGLKDKMPGSATEGYTDSQTYGGGGQFHVLINLTK